MNPNLTSSSGIGKDEPFRITRLEKVLKMYSIQKDGLKNQDIPDIVALHDHKGQLTVIWRNKPSHEQKNIIEKIWESQNELSDNVVHKFE